MAPDKFPEIFKKNDRGEQESEDLDNFQGAGLFPPRSESVMEPGFAPERGWWSGDGSWCRGPGDDHCGALRRRGLVERPPVLRIMIVTSKIRLSMMALA